MLVNNWAVLKGGTNKKAVIEVLAYVGYRRYLLISAKAAEYPVFVIWNYYNVMDPDPQGSALILFG